MAVDMDHLVVKFTVVNVTEPPAVYRYCGSCGRLCIRLSIKEHYRV